MKRSKSIEDQLREKMPPLRTEFRRELRAQLFEKAEHHLKRPSSFMPIFTLLFKNMKRYSFAYLTVLVIAVFSITSIFKTPLSAQEVLANSLENYKEIGPIFHEKIIHERYENGKLIDSSMDDNYFDNSGQFLQLIKNPYTEEISQVHLNVIDDLGYEYSFSTPMAGFETDKIDQQKRLSFFKEEKIYCIERSDEDPKIASMLRLSSQDISNYDVSSIVADDQNDLNWHSNLAESYIENLKKEDSHNKYEQVQEEGKSYYLFKEDYSGVILWFYIDAKTYELDHFDAHYPSQPEILEKNIILASHYIEEDKNSDLFNPDSYKNIEITPGDHFISFRGLTYSASKIFEENGCYDSKMNKMEDSFLENIPQSILKAWFSRIDEQQPTWYPSAMGEKESFPFNYQSLKMPSDSSVESSYEPGVHPGWTFKADIDQNKEVYVPVEGKVLDISNEAWNGSYGNTIVIGHKIHGIEFKTKYSFLDKILVKVGQDLKEGEKIGTMGKSGRYTLIDSSGSRLLFQLILNGENLDPSLLWQKSNLKPPSVRQ